VTAACSGFIFGLNVATQYLLTGHSKRVLVVAAEIMTRTLNWKDRTTCISGGMGPALPFCPWTARDTSSFPPMSTPTAPMERISCSRAEGPGRPDLP